MTNINCSSNCIYQKDGKCSYENISISSLSTTDNCSYYKYNLKPQKNS